MSAVDGSTALHLATQQGKLQVGPGCVAHGSPPFWGSLNTAVVNPYFWRGVRLTSHENWRKMKVKEGSDTFFWLGSHKFWDCFFGWYWLLMVQKSCEKTTWDVKNPVTKGVKYQLQLVQDFFPQLYYLGGWSAKVFLLCFLILWLENSTLGWKNGIVSRNCWLFRPLLEQGGLFGFKTIHKSPSISGT